MCVYLHAVRHACRMSVHICVCVVVHAFTCIDVFNTEIYVEVWTMCILTVSLLCVHLYMCIISRLCGGASVGQCEAEPEGVHQEDSVPGQPAAQFVEDFQPRQWRTLMP